MSTEPDPIGEWSELTSVRPDEGGVLAHRLRLAAETLGAEFGELSRADAERLILQAAKEILSAASVVQFVPTFAERRARQILQRGLPSTADSSLDPTTSEPEPTRRSPTRPPTSKAADGASVPRWPDTFYATEAKRLLERARLLRATTLAVRSEGY